MSVRLQDTKGWGARLGTDEHCDFFRSPCGRVLLGMWKSGGAVAGVFITIHTLHVLEPFFSVAPDHAWQLIHGKPAVDDLDSRLGLHGYRVLLTLRGARAEC